MDAWKISGRSGALCMALLKSTYTESPSLWIKMEVENMVNEVGSRPKCKAK
jgi:hypothetical protein